MYSDITVLFGMAKNWKHGTPAGCRMQSKQWVFTPGNTVQLFKGWN